MRLSTLPSLLLALPLLQPVLGASHATNATAEDPSEVPYYGLSPPVYPAPIAQGASSTAWADAFRRAKALVGQMTLEEKINVTLGFNGTCVGNTGTVARLGIPALCFADSPSGIRGQEFVSAFPAEGHAAATFDTALLYQYGYALGREYRDRGVHVALGPVAGPLGRIARGGRNWEGLGSDPYLAGRNIEAVVRGMQDAGVIATAKHFLLNEQEYRRNPTLDAAGRIVGQAMSANVDDRTVHELYLFPFMDALRAGAGAVMCSYQRANHSYASQNAKLLNGLLKTELGFEGFVVSDWAAQHTGVASALAGLDVAMPHSEGFWADGLLAQAVRNGSVPAARVDDMATRLLAAWHYVGEAAIGAFPSPPAVFSNAQAYAPADVQNGHGALIRAIGAAGTVLVKNVNGTLPLRSPRFLAVYGYDAVVKPVPWSTPARYGGGYDVNFGWNTLNGTLVTGGGSGSNTPPYIVAPFHALQNRVTAVGGTLRWDFYSEKPPVAYVNADACLVFINAYASENFDRPSLTDAFSDNLVNNVAGLCGNTIVVLHSAGTRVVDAWIDHPNVTAVLFAGLPGQESGNSLVDVLYGDVNPSGRFTFTVAKAEADYGALLNSTVSAGFFPESNFAEGVYTDYRAFARRAVAPRFPFGFGLSYTTFGYSGLSTKRVAARPAPYPSDAVPVVQGGHPALWDDVAQVAVTVNNTGLVPGTEVAQLYIGVPGADSADGAADGDAPVRQLRGFHRVGPLAPGDGAQVRFPLTRRDLSVWDVTAQQWLLRRGTYKVYVGASSQDIRLQGTFTIP